MKSFLVRIYRRPTTPEEPLVGVVEMVGEAGARVLRLA